MHIVITIISRGKWMQFVIIFLAFQKKNRIKCHCVSYFFSLLFCNFIHIFGTKDNRIKSWVHFRPDSDKNGLTLNKTIVSFFLHAYLHMRFNANQIIIIFIFVHCVCVCVFEFAYKFVQRRDEMMLFLALLLFLAFICTKTSLSNIYLFTPNNI